jgi:hypothetical protein
MGIFDSDDSEDEVKISPDEGEEESRLKDEVETEIVDASSKDNSTNDNAGSERGRKIRERSNSRGKNTFGGEKVSLEDIHKQNERIIELLEELSGEDSNEQQEMEGDLNGVL